MDSYKKIELQSFLRARKVEWRVLLLITLCFLFGLWLVYQAKSRRPLEFADIPDKFAKEIVNEKGKKELQPGELLNLSQLKDAKYLIPYLTNFEEGEEKNFAAYKIFKYVKETKTLKNVGSLAGIRVSEKEFRESAVPERYKSALEVKKAAVKAADPDGKEPDPEKVTVPLVKQISSIKSSFIVRTPGEFLNSLIFATLLFLLAFWGPHFYWRMIKFQGSQLIMPNIFALSSFGFLMMVSLRDPLRDMLIFADFARGVLGGGIIVAILTSFDYYDIYYRVKAKFGHIDLLIVALPILFCFILCGLLIWLGEGPGGSDAKVNLNIAGIEFQPSEIIKVLMVFFTAAYFHRNWELIKHLSEGKYGLFSIPRIKDVWIVFSCVAMVLGLFIFQKDLGPALLMAGTFLTLFAVLRGQVLLSAAGFLFIIGGYAFNYFVYTFSKIAVDRLNIWVSPWNTSVSGGEQIVQSFWALATGGLAGTGIGLGDPRFAPASHTDLILSSLGEEFGFIGLLAIFALFTTLFYRCVNIALNTTSIYTFFLILGLTVINALQILFISAAIFGMIPLSGVVSPFLSYGSTSMIINFISFGVILVISAQQGEASADIKQSFVSSTRWLSYGFGVLALIVVLNAAWIQLWTADEIVVKSVLAPQSDEVRLEKGYQVTYTGIRRYQENPRIRQLLRELPYGSIYDRNGVPMASSNWDELQNSRENYKTLGVSLENVCQKGRRCYPFGSKTFLLLGDINTKENWKGPNNFIEREYELVLTGLTDQYVKETPETIRVQRISQEPMPFTGDTAVNAEINPLPGDEGTVGFTILRREYGKDFVSLLRSRYSPINTVYRPAYSDLHTSVDMRLQLNLTDVLQNALAAKKQKGAIIVLDPQTGDLLANVNYPFPENDTSVTKNVNAESDSGENNPSERLLDRARWAQYPPGSVFKVVTGIAALRHDPSVLTRTFPCGDLGNGRVGRIVRGQRVVDQRGDPIHGDVAFEKGLTLSCNAYFAQLGIEGVGASELFRTLKLFGMSVSFDERTDNADKLEIKENLIHSSYGQGSILVTPFQIAKVAATVANDGMLPFGRWVTDENNKRDAPLQMIISASESMIVANAMRKVVTEGTAKKLANSPIQIAGKTGTAENSGTSHSWFMGFAPSEKAKKIAFAVIVENGGGGSGVAAEISGKVVLSSQQLGIIQ